MKKIFSSVMTMVIALAMVSCGGNANNGAREAQELSGAGATFPLPFYNVVFEEFSQANGDAVAYGGIGSGGGKRVSKGEALWYEREFTVPKKWKGRNVLLHFGAVGAIVNNPTILNE